ncbi:MAG: hypothetical protein AW09_000271 [Candidatus Accumulibacter phosphatis]|uniref:Uncharacterized protein n=1 Tax=Candidatus Accumulibacter phosphatis TaxID=327160 RepID=A0A080LZM4_9PROT|nr:MAG: hypothetical protein AW09_000271 [Candidatus Accumulibacter phosphatis]
MTNDAQDMRLLALFVLGVTHRLAIHRQTFVVARIDPVPLLAGLIKRGWIDTDQNVTNDGFTGYAVVSLLATTAKAFARPRLEVFGPTGDGLVTAHPAEGRSRRDGQHAWQRMAPALGTPRIRDGGKEVGEQTHVFGTEHDSGGSLTVGGGER